MITTTSLLAVLAFAPAAPAEADAAAIAIADPGIVSCAIAPNDAIVVDQREAPPAGAWWLRQTAANTHLLGDLSLRATNGDQLVAAGLRRTTVGVSFEVPASGVAGDTFELLENGADTGIALSVVAPVDPAPAAAVLDDATPGATVAVECPEAFCTFGEIPRAQTVEITYEGGPVVLDIAATDPTLELVDTTPRNIDSMLLAHVDTPTTLTFVAGPGRNVSTPVDLHVRLTDVATRAVLADTLLPLGTLDEPPADDNITVPPPCGAGGGFPRGGCDVGLGGGCLGGGCFGGGCPPVAAVLLVSLRALRRRRSR